MSYLLNYPMLSLLIAESNAQKKRHERVLYDHRMMRGPMIEADIDWRVPCDYRPMSEGDL